MSESTIGLPKHCDRHTRYIAGKELADLKSAERWIPVSEGLPEMDGTKYELWR